MKNMNQSETIMKRILAELTEEELSAVPPDEEIRKTHIFSERFLRNMNSVLKAGAEIPAKASTEQPEKNETGQTQAHGFAGKISHRQRRIRVLAACIVCALVLGVVLTAWNGTFSLRMGSSSDSAGSADQTLVTADVGIDGTDAYDADTAETYAEEESETSESAADSGTTNSETLTDADAESAGETDSSYEQKLIRTVNLTAETTDFDNLVASVKARTKELGGYVESSEISDSTDSISRWAYLTLRIPADELDAFLNQVNEEANVTCSSESVEDVTLTYSDLESHVEALRTEQETLMSMLEQATTMEDILAIQSRLTEVRYEIESYESQIKVYDNQVTYSTVYLDLSEVVRESAGTGITFGEQVSNRFSDSLYNIANGLRSFAIGFLGAIPYLVTLAVVVVVCVFAYKKARKLQKKIHDRKFGKNEDSQK